MLRVELDDGRIFELIIHRFTSQYPRGLRNAFTLPSKLFEATLVEGSIQWPDGFCISSEEAVDKGVLVDALYRVVGSFEEEFESLLEAYFDNLSAWLRSSEFKATGAIEDEVEKFSQRLIELTQIDDDFYEDLLILTRRYDAGKSSKLLTGAASSLQAKRTAYSHWLEEIRKEVQSRMDYLEANDISLPGRILTQAKFWSTRTFQDAMQDILRYIRES